MRNLIIAALVLFLLYTNSTFRSFTIEGLQSITNFIKELPKEKIEEEKKETEKDTKEESGFSTY
mgnify:CR=1 FL=1|tara:strand:- start:865 stop:1056 length:192 start_codon:yes stop_codon:yes gene_type:complete